MATCFWRRRHGYAKEVNPAAFSFLTYNIFPVFHYDLQQTAHFVRYKKRPDFTNEQTAPYASFCHQRRGKAAVPPDAVSSRHLEGYRGVTPPGMANLGVHSHRSLLLIQRRCTRAKSPHETTSASAAGAGGTRLLLLLIVRC